MKQLKTYSEIEMIVNHKLDIYQEINGKKYTMAFVSFITTPLVDIIRMMQDGKLWYDPTF